MAAGESPRWNGWVGLAGALGFAAIVGALHGLQPDYDAREQLVSELASGPHGWAMLPAFAFLALSVLGIWLGLRTVGAAALPCALLAVAAPCMLAAGVFPFGRFTLLHTAAVMVGFNAILLVMALLPSRAGRLQSRGLRTVSWLLAAGVIVSTVAGGWVMMIGVAQRLAAACFIAWLCSVGWKLIRH
jgi:hypothetical protein